jgi:hypothetical protein
MVLVGTSPRGVSISLWEKTLRVVRRRPGLEEVPGDAYQVPILS